MSRRWIRNLGIGLLAALALLLLALAAIYLRDQANVAAQARATPQIEPAAAADPNHALAGLPEEVNVATAHLLSGREDVLLVDVRSKGEYVTGHAPGARLVPLGELAERLDEIPRDPSVAVLVMCRTGRRSGAAVEFLRSQGYQNVHNVIGGYRAWRKAGFPYESP